MGAVCSKSGKRSKLINASEMKQLFKEDLAAVENKIMKIKSEMHKQLTEADEKRVFKAEREMIVQLLFQEQLLRRANLGISACITLEQYESLFTHHLKKQTIPKEIEMPLKELLATLMVFTWQQPPKYTRHLQQTEAIIDKQFGKGSVASLKKFDGVPKNLLLEALKDFTPTDDQLDQRLYEFCISEKIYDLTKVDKPGHQVSKIAAEAGILDNVRRMSLGVHVDDVNLEMGDVITLPQIGERRGSKSGREGSILETPKFSLIESSNLGDSIRKYSQFKDGEKRDLRTEGDKPNQNAPAFQNRASFGFNLFEGNSEYRGSIAENDAGEELNEGANLTNKHVQKLDSMNVKQEKNSAFIGRVSFGADNSRRLSSENLHTSPEKRGEPNTLGSFKPTRDHNFQETNTLVNRFEEKLPPQNPVLGGPDLLRQKLRIDSEIVEKYPKYASLKQKQGDFASSSENGVHKTKRIASFGEDCHGKSESEESGLNFQKTSPLKKNNIGESLRRSVVGLKPIASENEESYNKLRSELANDKAKYIDPTFRAELLPTLTHKPETAANMKNLKRYRPCDTLKSFAESIFGEEGINPSSVRPGPFTDPDFASIIAGLAEHPKLVKNIIFPHQRVAEGVYSVAMNEAGEWKIFLIDDILPGELTAPAFTTNSDKGLWVGLLEKAFAKSLGSYQAISECSTLSMLITLTGLPCELYELGAEYATSDNRDVLWDYLSQIRGREYLILAKFKGKTKTEEELKTDASGKRKSYSFALLDVKNVTLPDGKMERMVKLRNRWGAQFDGKYTSSSSKNWTPQIKKALGFEESQKNVTWFTFKEFLENFSELYMAKLDSNFAHTSLSIDYTLQSSIAKNVSFIWINVEKSTPITLLFTQNHRKQLEVRGNRKDYKYSYIRVAIGRLDQYENIGEWNGGDFRCAYQVPLELYLEQGEYMLVTETFWEQKHSQQLTIGAYSESPVWMEKKPVSIYQYQLYLEQLAVSYIQKKLAQTRPTKAITTMIPFSEVPEIAKYWSQRLPGLWFCYYKNESRNYVWREEINIAFTEGTAAVACLPDHRNIAEQAFHHEIDVLQRSDKIILIKFTNGKFFEAKISGKSEIIKK